MTIHFYCLTEVSKDFAPGADAGVVYGTTPSSVGYLLEQYVHTPTLVIELFNSRRIVLFEYIRSVFREACRRGVRFEQVVFDSSFDPVYRHDEVTTILNDFAKEIGIKCFLFVSNFELKSHSHLTEINYPCWLISSQINQPKITYSPGREYKFSCLNRNPRFHRLLTYSLIKQKKLLDDCVFSYSLYEPTFNRYVDYTHFLPDVGNLSDEYYHLAKAALWDAISDLPIHWKNEVFVENDHSVNHDAYLNTYCNIVTETDVNLPFHSEKIWKPLSAGQLFLVVGPAGINEWLNSLGFYTFDSEYDSEPDFVKRLLLMIKVMQNRQNNVPRWFDENADKIKHNYDLYHSEELVKKIFEPAIQLLNSR